MAMDGSGTAQASVLDDPYEKTHYSNGTMPTAKGYTGQHADAATGLDYYGARYYDAAIGQFASADTAGDGLNRYAYVHDDPETFTDPTGHYRCDDSGCSRGHGNHGGGGCTYDCSGSSGGGSSGGDKSKSCTHDCAPGCKGTAAQCKVWQAGKDAKGAKYDEVIGIAQAFQGGFRLLFDLIKLLRDGGSDVLDALIRGVSIVGDFLNLVSGILNILQATGHDVSGFRQWVSGIGAAVNYVAGILNGLKGAINWFVEQGLNAAWRFFTSISEQFTPVGVFVAIGIVVLKSFFNLDAAENAVDRIFFGIIDTYDALKAHVESESIDAYCTDMTLGGDCNGYQ